MVHIVGETRGGDQLALCKIIFRVTYYIIIYLLRCPYLSTGPTLQPISLKLPMLPLMLLFYLATAIMSTSASDPLCFMVVTLALVAQRIVHDILRLGYALGKDPDFTCPCSVQDSLILIDHACTWAHMCFTPIHIGDGAPFLPLTV